ncbi:MAG: tetratricopeptide repeat protein [Symploca sp. SIO2C1]|nr:tetratricopeptide repeat protein [Symploca sp. SIO2C1]
MSVEDTTSHKVSSWNSQTYQRLQLALSLGLRRQLFLAICDDLNLRNRLAAKLHAELGKSSSKAPMEAQDYPKLVSLNLNLREPHPLRQIAQWLAQQKKSGNRCLKPGFQILGVERLTEQPPGIQQLFLRHLQASERHLLNLESTLLLWLPRPWFYNIQQSVPKFWQSHTGLFEFEGEPTPLPPVGSLKPETSHTSKKTSVVTAPLSISKTATVSFQEDLRKLLTDKSVKVTKKALPLFLQDDEQQTTYDGNSFPLVFPKAKEHTPQTPPPKLQTDVQLPGNTSQELEDLKSEEPVDNTQLSKIVQKYQNKTEDSNVPFEEQLSNLKPVTQDASLADTYLELGNYYRHVIEQGDASEENLMLALQAYEQALQYLEEDSPTANDSVKLAEQDKPLADSVAANTPLSDILNDVGNLYWMLSRCPNRRHNKTLDIPESAFTITYLEQSIQTYQLALAKLIAEETPNTYAMIQNNLGAAYGDLARHQEPTENLEQSILAYQEALNYRHEESDSIKYASTQNNLGTAYWNLAQQQSPVSNLHGAIAAYTEALSTYDLQLEQLDSNSTLDQSQTAPKKGTLSLNWAMIQNNLGTAYWNLAQYEQPETFLNQAIVAYQAALKYRKPEVTPAACAATQNNLGTAYWHLADQLPDESEAKVEYLEQCITVYKSAIALAQKLQQATPAIPINFDLSITHKNLGLAHYQLATQPQFSLTKETKLAHLEAALQQHLQTIATTTAESDVYQNALNYIIKTIRAFYRESGITGQNEVLSKVPAKLLPEILPHL